MDLSRFNLEQEEYFREACEAALDLIRIGDMPREMFEEELRNDFLSLGGNPAQWDDMLNMLRNYCNQPPAKKSQLPPEEQYPACLKDLSRFKLEDEDCFRNAFEVKALLIRIGDISPEEFEDELRKDFLSWGGEPSQCDEMQTMFRNYCEQPPTKKSQPVSESRHPAWLYDESNIRIRTIVDGLEKPQRFRSEYKDCIRAFQALVTNAPLSRKARNALLKHIAGLKSEKSIKKNFRALPIPVRRHVRLIMRLRKINEVKACKWILSGGQDGDKANELDTNHNALSIRSDFTYIETRLALSFIIAGGRITKYMKKGERMAQPKRGKTSKYSDEDTDYASDFILLLQQFRIDCGEAAPDPRKITTRHISNLLVDIEKQVFGEGDDNKSVDQMIEGCDSLIMKNSEWESWMTRLRRTYNRLKSHAA